MPIVHRFVPEHNLVVSVWTGLVPDDEALASYEELYSHDEWSPGTNELADLRRVDMSKITTDGLRGIAKLVRKAMKGSGKEFQSAIIAPDDLAYALVHMYGLINEESKEDANVFRTVAEAVTWLRVPASVLDD